MTLDEKILQMLDFYTVSNLSKYPEAIERNNWDEKDAWEFLDKFTREDYKITGLEPDIDMYISFYAYRQEGGKCPPYD